VNAVFNNLEPDTGGGLYFPVGNLNSLVNYGWAAAYASTFRVESGQAGHASLYHLKMTLATTTRGLEQPWHVSRNFLRFKCSIPFEPPSVGSYSMAELHQFSIPPQVQVADFLLMEPTVGENETRHDALVAPGAYGYGITLDTWSSTDGASEIPGENPGDPPVQSSVAGVTDHWLMLPQGTPKTLYLNGTTNGPHRIAYMFNGVDVAEAPVAGVVRTESHYFNTVTVTGSSSGYAGRIDTGIAYGATGAVTWALNKPLLRTAVLEERELKVTLHPIALNSTRFGLVAPAHTPTKVQLEAYLNAVFGLQANVWSTVTLRDLVTLDWDLGVGVEACTYGFNNGRLDILYLRDAEPLYSMSAEEMAIHNASPPDPTADVNVYFVAAPGLLNSGWNGMAAMNYYGPLEPERDTPAHLNAGSLLGFAGKAEKGTQRAGVVWVWDYPDSNSINNYPDHRWTIAHEIMHYVGDVMHSTLPASISNNHMPNCDNESRLMTGRDGPKRKTGPKTLLKNEWQRLNELEGFKEQNSN